LRGEGHNGAVFKPTLTGKAVFVSAAIKTSLLGLNDSLEKLEAAVEKAMKQPKLPQDDLFGAVSNGNRQGGGDVKLFARRLDSAIDKVEKLLKESRA